MVLVLIGIAVGILIMVILIIKATKTPSRDVLGINLHCIKCGAKTGAQSVQNVKKILSHSAFNLF